MPIRERRRLNLLPPLQYKSLSSFTWEIGGGSQHLNVEMVQAGLKIRETQDAVACPQVGFQLRHALEKRRIEAIRVVHPS